MYFTERSTRECYLFDDGKIHTYDSCSSKPGSHDRQVFTYLGYGTIYRLDGYKQTGKQKYWFYTYRSLFPRRK